MKVMAEESGCGRNFRDRLPKHIRSVLLRSAVARSSRCEENHASFRRAVVLRFAGLELIRLEERRRKVHGRWLMVDAARYRAMPFPVSALGIQDVHPSCHYSGVGWRSSCPARQHLVHAHPGTRQHSVREHRRSLQHLVDAELRVESLARREAASPACECCWSGRRVDSMRLEPFRHVARGSGWGRSPGFGFVRNSANLQRD